MTSALRVLLLEDDPFDAELIRERLEDNHFVCDVIRVQTRDEFVAGLQAPGINLILADYKLPSFDGLSALKLAVESHPDLPFIFVSGALGEEVAIEAVKIGATDYVVKSRLSRLVPSVQRALREARERAERKRAEEALRRSETFLAEGQRISHTGSWEWNVASGKLVWSEEHGRIFGFDPSTAEPTFQLFSERVHPDDRSQVKEVLDEAIRTRSGFSLEFRIVLPDGTVKHLHGVGRPILSAAGNVEHYIGTTMDITERKRGEDALRTAQTDLTRVARLTTMGELAASIAHEINQPLGAIVANGNACLRWLAKEQPHFEQARQAAERIVRDGHRAGDIIRSVRALLGTSEPDMAELDINDAIREVLILTRSERHIHNVALEMELADGLPTVMGDRVRLQQVVLNLVVNAIEAMSGCMSESRMLRVQSRGDEPCMVRIAIEDSGPGIAPDIMDRVFEAFFTTKSSGMGMGLSICRSIIAAHGGRLWVSPAPSQGSVFQFTVPITAREEDVSAEDGFRHAGGRLAKTASSS